MTPSERAKAYRAKNPGKASADARAWREKNPSAASRDSARYYADHRESEKARTAAYRQAHREKYRALERANNRAKVAKNARRRARKLQATPAWADLSAIEAFYADCPAGMEVDHYYPLMGRTVCGLHVVSNLQYLTPAANRSKGNRFP